uniref:Mitochondrial import receptor subunit TOM20 homolog n=1 Tax=Equus caballus TaxID=9796 RepID=A0A9L0RUI2_HORSE
GFAANVLVPGPRRRRPGSSVERRWWAGTAPSPPVCAGPSSSGTAFTSTARDGVTPTSRTGCENEERNKNLPRRELDFLRFDLRLSKNCSDTSLIKLPDLKDAEAVQKFFLEEIQLGEELLAQAEYEKGVDHLTNAIAVCGQPQQLLQVLQQTLPPPVFQMLLTKLPTISQRIVSAQSLAEDDVE